MTRWNPNDPQVIGPEFWPVAREDVQVGPGVNSPALAQQFRSNTAETIGNVRVFGYRGEGSSATARYIVEVVTAGQEVVPPPLTVSTYAPDASFNLGLGTTRRQPSGDLTNLHLSIDNDPPDYLDWLGISVGCWIDLEFACGAFSLTGRVRSVGLLLTTESGYGGFSDGTTAARSPKVRLVSGDGSIEYAEFPQHVIPPYQDGVHGQAYYNFGEINPATGNPWTETDIRNLSTPTTGSRLRIVNMSPTYIMLLAEARLVVCYESSEKRLARGTFLNTAFPATTPGWTGNIPIYNNAGAANWSKGNATNYSLLVRRADQGDFGTDQFNPPYLPRLLAAAGTTPPADLILQSITPQTLIIAETGAHGSVPLPTNSSVVNGIMPFLLLTTAPGDSVDTQPYGDFYPLTVYSGVGATEAEFRSTGGGGTYRRMRLVCGRKPGSLAPTAELVLTVKRRSDNVTMGTCRVPAASAQLIGSGMAPIEALADASFALANATQYYVTFTSTSDVNHPWVVALLVTWLQGDAGSYSGSTDVVDPIWGFAAGIWSFAPADAAFVLDAAVLPPTNFAATAAYSSITEIADCGVIGHPYMSVTWTERNIGAAFNHYEIQRRAPDGVTWQTVANLTNEDIVQWYDFEARIGVVETYRMRTWNDVGAVSDWTATDTGTLSNTLGCAYTFSSNEVITMLSYADVYDSVARREYAFPEAEETELRTMHGRDFQAAFRPGRDRGVAFERDLLVGAIVAPTAGVGPAAAKALRDYARAPRSYVCVRDHYGNRWFGSLTVDSLSENQPSQIHRVHIAFVETTTTPSTPDSL